MGFSRQEHWRGLPCPPPGDLLDQGSNPGLLTSPALAGGYLATGTPWASSLILPLAPVTIREICKLMNSHGRVNSRTQEAHSWRCGASEAIDSVPWVSEIRRGCAQAGALCWDRRNRDWDVGYLRGREEHGQNQHFGLISRHLLISWLCPSWLLAGNHSDLLKLNFLEQSSQIKTKLTLPNSQHGWQVKCLDTMAL